MISRSPAWILATRDNEPRPRRNGMDARRPLRELRRRRAMGAAVQTPPRRANGSRRHRPVLLRYWGLRDAGLGSVRGVTVGREKGSYLDAI